MGTTLHFFIADRLGFDPNTLERALTSLRREFGLKIQAATFEGQRGYTVSITVPPEMKGTVHYGTNLSTQLQDSLTLDTKPRPVFPGRYSALRGPTIKNGDTLLSVPMRRSA